MPEYDPLHMIIAPAVVNNSGPRTNLPDIDRLFDHLEATAQRRLVLYFHGGLNRKELGLQVAEKMRNTFRQADAHALSLVWETGVQESLKNELAKITQSALFRELRRAVKEGVDAYINSQVGVLGGFTLETATAEEIESIPLDEKALQAQFQTTTATNYPLHDFLQDNLHAPEEATLDPTFVSQVSTAGTPGTLGDDSQEGLSLTRLVDPIGLAKALAQIGWRVLQRRANGQYHGTQATLVEEIVRAVYLLGGPMKLLWDNMKERAAKLWQVDERATSQPPRYFLEKLQAYQQKHPETTIDLIGHSAGSIVIAHLLAQTKRDYPSLHFRRVIFLAPALTMDLFYKQVVTQQDQYDDFVCFTMKEERELADAVFAPFYPHSLLYFVSGVLEEDTAVALTGLARFYIAPPQGKLPVQEPYLLDCRDFLLVDGRLVLSDTTPSAPSGQCSEAISHGAFNEEPKTLASLQYLVASPAISSRQPPRIP